MSDLNENATQRRSRAAEIVDRNVEKLATILDRLRSDLTPNEGAGQAVPMAAALGGRLETASDKLRATSGEKVVDYAKGQIVLHPTVLTFAAAAAGAAIAQIAIAAIRREERQPASSTIESAPL
jgi:hypothetical protein